MRLRDYVGAISQLRELAQKGSPEAQFRLAGLYRSGRGVRRELEKSHELYHQAALAGHAQAQFAYALLVEKTRAPAAVSEARKWYRMAAAQGHARAAGRLDQLREMPALGPRNVTAAEIFNAIRHNDGTLIDELIAQGVDLDLIDSQGNTPVMAAIQAGWPRLAASLVTETGYPGQANADGMLPLQLASGRGYEKLVSALIDSNLDIDQSDARGNTALMLAIEAGHTEIAALLLERGANPELLNNKNQSAVDIAVAVDNAQGKALLGRHGIKPRAIVKAAPAIDLAGFKSAVNRHGARYAGWPLLNIAIELGEDRVINQIVELEPDLAATDPEGNSALLVAARKGDFVHLRLLLVRGGDPNSVNVNNETALYLAVSSKCIRCVGLLIEHRADPSAETGTGVTALEVAIQSGQADIARLLLAAGGDYAGIHRVLLIAVQKKLDKLASELVDLDSRLAATDVSGRSLLWHSADKGLEKTTAKLASSGKVALDQQDKNGHSAISQAVARGHFRIVRLLADRGAKLSQRSAAGNSLLMLSVQAKNTELIDFLLTRGIDVNARNNLGNTALMLAAASAQNPVIEQLIAAGADLQLRNSEDLNAFQLATDSGHPETAQLIHNSSSLIFKLFN